MEQLYTDVSRKELKKHLKDARVRAGTEKKIYEEMEVFSPEYREQKTIYAQTVGEIKEIKRELFRRKKKYIVTGVTFGVILAIFLGATGIKRGEDGGLKVVRWPGIDFEFTVYKDHVRADSCTDVTIDKLVIPDYIWGKPVTEIGEKFHAINNETEVVVLGENVEYIGDFAFYDCVSLKRVEGGKKVFYVDELAFSGCETLEYIEIGENIEVVGLGAFNECKELKNIITTDALRKVEDYAFFQSGLQEIYIPSTLTDIGFLAFGDTPWLEEQKGKSEEYVVCGDQIAICYIDNESEVYVPRGIKKLSGTFSITEGIGTIYIPDSVIEIGYRTFDSYDQITVYIPDSVTTFSGWTEKGREADDYINGYMEKDLSNLLIVTTQGSAAQSYAEDVGIRYELVEDVQAIYASTLEEKENSRE